MDRAKAKSMTRTVQAVAAGLVLAAVAAAMVPLSATKAESTEGVSPPPAPKPVDTSKVEVDTALLASALNTVSGPVKNQPAPVEPPVGEDPVKPPVTGLDAWRYLGAIMSSSYKRAIVVIDDKQQLLAEGQTLNDVEVVQIDKLFIKLKQGENEKQIDLAPRQRAALTVLDPSGAGRVTNGAPNNGMGNTGGRTLAISPPGSSPDANARLQRNMERMKDAKARGDDKAAVGYEEEIIRAKEGKGEKGAK